MLSAKYRIAKNEILEVIKKSKKFSNENFDLRIQYDDSIRNHLFAFIVSKKVNKSAVVRNTIKRKFRAAVYSILKDNKLKKGKYIFIARKDKIKNIKSNDLAEKIVYILQN